MKNIFVLFLSVFAITLFSTQSFAAATTSSTTSGNSTIILGTSPNSVTIGLSANDTAAYLGGTTGKTYAAITYNPLGAGQEYGTASDTSDIMQQPHTGTVTTPTKGDSYDVTSGSWLPVGS